MRVAILCPGPSLPKTWDGNADLTIAVNRAALFHLPDWFCAGDTDTFQRVKIRPRIGICGSDHALGLLGDELPQDVRHVRWSAFDMPNKTTECNFSVVAAVALAAHLGGKSIRLYGADMAGVHDYDGTEGAARNEDRWTKERGELAQIVSAVARKGVSFDRIM